MDGGGWRGSIREKTGRVGNRGLESTEGGEEVERRVREVSASLVKPDPCTCGGSGIKPINGFVPLQPLVQYHSDYRINDYYCITSGS